MTGPVVDQGWLGHGAGVAGRLYHRAHCAPRTGIVFKQRAEKYAREIERQKDELDLVSRVYRGRGRAGIGGWLHHQRNDCARSGPARARIETEKKSVQT